MVSVQFETTHGVFEGTFRSGTIVQALVGALPLSAVVNRWGEEIYFDVPVKMANSEPTRDVTVGDIGYWPEGPSLWIFFGKTPASKGHEPRPASDITIVGHTDAPVELLRTIAAGIRMRVGLVHQPAPKARVPRQA